MSKEQTPLTEFLFPNNLRLAADVLILDHSGENVLLGHRQSEVGYDTWGLLGGRQEGNELIRETLKREIHEELGANIKIDLSNSLVAIRYNQLPPFFVPHLTFVIKGLYIDGSIDVPAGETTQDWQWFNYKNYPGNLFSCNKLILSNFFEGKITHAFDLFESDNTPISLSLQEQTEIINYANNILSQQDIILPSQNNLLTHQLL